MRDARSSGSSGSGRCLLLYLVGAYAAAIAQWLVASGVANADDRRERRDQRGDRRLRAELRPAEADRRNRRASTGRSTPLWLLAAWIVLQMMTGLLAGVQGFLLATPAHIGGFIAGLLLQRPLLLWRYRKA